MDSIGEVAECPSVSVIVVNYNGLTHLGPCLSSLSALAFPQDNLEVILVDNGSTDGSADWVRANFPDAHLLENCENVGFARGNNQGVAAARGKYVAFLNNDTRVDSRWLSELVTAVTSSPGVACAASKILSWDGRTVDFVGGRLNFYGFGFQIDYGLPHVNGNYNEERNLLFACGAAMLVDRAVFLDVGGFDEDYFAYFEDVDLGWRLWLMGYSVVFAPRSIVYHRHHGTSRSLPEPVYRTLCERNSFYTIYKNYEQQNLDKILPAAILLSAKRGLRDSQIRPETFKISGDMEKDDSLRKVSKLGLTCLVAMDEFVENLPKFSHKRQVIQSRRRRTDREVLEQFQKGLTTPVIHAESFVKAQQTITEHLGIPALFREPPSRALLICHDVVGENMAGPAIRYWEIAKVLSRDFEVTLAAPGKPTLESDSFQVKGYARSDPNSIVPLVAEADIIIAFGFVLHLFPLLQSVDKPLIVDIYDPFTLEDLEVYGNRSVEDQTGLISLHTGVLNHQLRTGDFFICANERQRDYWLGMLTANNRVNPSTYTDDKTLRRLIDTVPFGLPSAPPEHKHRVLKGVHPGISPSDKVVLWGGGIWEWLDPITLVQAMAKISCLRTDVKLFFLGKQHFDPVTVPETGICAATIQLCERLGILNRSVFFNEWTRYGERQNYLLEADIGVILHPNHVETRFSFRTRVLDYLWAGLPILSTRGDDMSGMVERFGLGKVVPPHDVDAVVGAILEMVDTPDLRETLRPNFERVARMYTWEKVAEPLMCWCRDPRKAADKVWQREQTIPRAVNPVKVTPPWELPQKALRLLKTTGASGLAREVRAYLRWRLADYGR